MPNAPRLCANVKKLTIRFSAVFSSATTTSTNRISLFAGCCTCSCPCPCPGTCVDSTWSIIELLCNRFLSVYFGSVYFGYNIYLLNSFKAFGLISYRI